MAEIDLFMSHSHQFTNFISVRGDHSSLSPVAQGSSVVAHKASRGFLTR